jgi:hypothetical protein
MRSKKKNKCVELVASKGVARGCRRELSDISLTSTGPTPKRVVKNGNFHFDGEMPTERLREA